MGLKSAQAGGYYKGVQIFAIVHDQSKWFKHETNLDRQLVY